MHKKIEWNHINHWYKELHEDSGRRQKSALKRCKTLEEVYLQQAYVDFIKKIELKNNSSMLPVIACVLAHARPSETTSTTECLSFEQQMAKMKNGQDSPIISLIRFRQLLVCKNENKLFRFLIRVVKQIEPFNVTAFAKDLFWWRDVKTQRKWALTYYENLPEKHLPKGS